MPIISDSNIEDFMSTEAAKSATEKLDDLFKSFDWRLNQLEKTKYNQELMLKDFKERVANACHDETMKPFRDIFYRIEALERIINAKDK